MTDAPNPDLDHAEELINQADETFERAHYAEAEAQYRAALALVEPLQAAFPEQSQVLKACCDLGLGRLLDIQGRFEETRALVQPLPPILIMDPDRLAIVFMTLGDSAACLGAWAVATQEFNFAYVLRVDWLGPSHPDTLDSLSALAICHHRTGEKDPARDLLRKAVKSAEKYRGDPTAQIGRVYRRQGVILMDDPAGVELARASLKQALAIFEASVGVDHPDYGAGLYTLADLLTRGSRWAEARILLLRALANHERVYGPLSFGTSFVLSKLSEVEQHLDHQQAAYEYAVRALISYKRSRGARSVYTRTALRRLVDLLDANAQSGVENALPFRTCLVALEIAASKRDSQKETGPSAQLTAEQAAEQLEQLVKRLEEQINQPPYPAEQ